MPSHRPGFTPYMDKPRRFRRNRFVSLRWQIAQDPNGRGVFTSHHMLDGGVYEGQVYHAPAPSHWNDLRFISHRHARQGLVYTATVRTALMAALDWAEDYAWEEEERLLTAEEYALAHPPLEFVPVGGGMYKLASRPEALFDRFGPEPVSAWALRARFLRQAVEKLPPIHASCRLDRGYKTGLGALFVVDLPQLTIDNLAQVVRDFWEGGEEAYERAPVDFSRANARNHQALHDMIQEQAAAWERMDHRARNLSP